jgi:para-aminobenzoate synthetase component I
MNARTSAKPDDNILCEVFAQNVEVGVSLDALNEYYMALPLPSILGGNTAEAGRFSYWAAEPVEVFEHRLDQPQPLERLHAALSKYRIPEKTQTSWPQAMFCGGWVGYFSYDLSRFIERLPVTTIDDLNMPLMRLSFYDRVIAYDRQAQCWWLVALQLSNDRQGVHSKLSTLREHLRQAQHAKVILPAPGAIDNIDMTSVTSNMSKADYLQALARIRDYIYAGDTYQINFSQRFSLPFDKGVSTLYHWQNTYNPSAYAAYLSWPGTALVSASPEMFLAVTSGQISTTPIKGTRPRLIDNNDTRVDMRALNQAAYQELLQSEKEQAELNMIVDLERNDLARVCIPGTRRVVQPRSIATYPTVFHAMATVSGSLRAHTSLPNILRATFPGGSITGAPKIRSMEIIDECEPHARAVYTGSIGFIGINGNVCLNIAIRTIIISDSVAYVQAGGGIVADSDPDAEYRETITKARALLAAIKSINRT